MEQLGGLFGTAPPHPVAAQGIDRLRRYADMPHHRNVAVNDAAHGGGYAHAALQFDGMGAALLQQPGRIAQGLGRVNLISHKGQVGDNQGVPAAPGHRFGMMNYIREGYRNSRVVAQRHHTQAVAHQYHRNGRGVGQNSGSVVIGGNHRDFFTPPLHCGQVMDGYSGHCSGLLGD